MTGYFKGRIATLNLPDPVLAPGYTFFSFDEKDVPQSYIQQWQTLLGPHIPWLVPKNAHVLFILQGQEVVASLFFIYDRQISTGMLHGGKCKKAHRRRGFYKYFCIKSFAMLHERGIQFIEEHTDKQILWPLWRSFGCTEVDTISHLAYDAVRK